MAKNMVLTYLIFFRILEKILIDFMEENNL